MAHTHTHKQTRKHTPWCSRWKGICQAIWRMSQLVSIVRVFSRMLVDSWQPLRIDVSWTSHVTYMYESCHTYVVYVFSSILADLWHPLHTDELCHTYAAPEVSWWWGFHTSDIVLICTTNCELRLNLDLYHKIEHTHGFQWTGSTPDELHEAFHVVRTSRGILMESAWS